MKTIEINVEYPKGVWTKKQALLIHVIIYVREAFKDTLDWMPEHRRNEHMKMFNLSNKKYWKK